jgi:hypothetical protein
MAVIGSGISLSGMQHEDFHYPFNLAASVVSTDVGSPVALDATSATTVKIAGDGDAIIGKLVYFEERSVEGIKTGTVTLRGGWTFPVFEGDAIAIGDTAVGGGKKGTVKKAGTTDHAANIVVDVSGGYATIIR